MMQSSRRVRPGWGLERAPRRRRDEAFSLIELMIAMSVMAFGLLGMLMLQAQAMGNSSEGRHDTAALSIANSVFEQTPRLPFSTLTADGLWKAPGWVSNSQLDPADGNLPDGVVAERMTDAAGVDHFEQMYRAYYRIAPDPSPTPNPGVRSVEVQVIWSDDNDITVTPTTLRSMDQTTTLSGLIFDNGL